MAKLTRNVWVDGVLYGPDGDDAPKDVLEQITNPKAYASDDEVEVVDDPDAPSVGDELTEEQKAAKKAAAPAKKAAAKKTAASGS